MAPSNTSPQGDAVTLRRPFVAILKGNPSNLETSSSPLPDQTRANVVGWPSDSQHILRPGAEEEEGEAAAQQQQQQQQGSPSLLLAWARRDLLAAADDVGPGLLAEAWAGDVAGAHPALAPLSLAATPSLPSSFATSTPCSRSLTALSRLIEACMAPKALLCSGTSGIASQGESSGGGGLRVER